MCMVLQKKIKPADNFSRNESSGTKWSESIDRGGHALSAATRRSEMTLDCSFLSDSRNFDCNQGSFLFILII